VAKKKSGFQLADISGSQKNKWKVLVVDDCRKTAELLKSELKNEAFDVHFVTSADEASKLIIKEESRPDLVLLDVIMPGIDGEQFCRFIKKNRLFDGVKVILCSSIEASQLEARAKKAGADGFIHKDEILGGKILDQLEIPERKP
jgi:PleD family two-component response regulator